MDSAALTTYLSTEWAEVIAETGIDPAYIVGIVEEVYAADSDLDTAYAEPLGDYYLLRRAVRVFSVDFDNTSSKGGSYRLSQRYAQLKALLAEAEAAVGWLVSTEDGGAFTVTSDWSLGAIEEAGA